nr:nadh-ubiquinone oxidoreductase 9.5 kda subunit [Quercus suber]
MAPVHFWSSPVAYLHWAARAKPAILWSIAVGSLGPVFLVVGPPIRRYFGDGPRQQIPLTYPIPKGPRQIPEGYDD